MTSFVPPPPTPEGSKPDRIIVVQVHPYGKEPSFTLALGNAVRDSLKDAGVQVYTSGAVVAELVLVVGFAPYGHTPRLLTAALIRPSSRAHAVMCA